MKSQLKLGSILAYTQMALNVIIKLLYTPIMLQLLGKSEYGLYNTVASTISMLSLLSLGFNSGYIRYFAVYKKNNDDYAIQRLNGLFIIIFSVIGLLAMACGLFLSFHLDLVFDDGLTSDEYKIARVLTLLLTFNLTMTFPMSVFQNIISAHERFVFLKAASMIRTVLSPLVTLPLLFMGYRSIAVVAVTVSVNLIVDIFFLFYVLVVMKERFVFQNFEKRIMHGLFSYTVFIAINSVIDQINWNIDKLLLGRFKGTDEVAVYSVGYTLYHCFMLFSTSISSVFTPRIHKIVNRTKENIAEQRKELTDLFTRVGRIQFLLLSLISTGFVFFGRFFIVNLWAKDDSYTDSYIVALFLILSASIALIQNLGIEIQRAENKHQFRSIIYLLMAGLNLVLSIILCQRYGAIGSTIGTAISLIVSNGLIMNIYYHKKCNIDIVYFWKMMIRPFLGILPPVLFGIIYVSMVTINSARSFAIAILLYSVIYVLSIWTISMNKSEKRLIKEPLNILLRRKNDSN